MEALAKAFAFLTARYDCVSVELVSEGLSEAPAMQLEWEPTEDGAYSFFEVAATLFDLAEQMRAESGLC